LTRIRVEVWCTMQKRIPKEFSLRSYRRGEEQKIVDFLNLCYGTWGDLDKWRWKNVQYPTFEKDYTTIAEMNKEIVGYGALFLRNLHVPSLGTLHTVTLGDAAVHPKLRRRGLYTSLREVRLSIANSKGAALILVHNEKESIVHKMNKKRGYIEIHYPVYIKVLNPRSVLKAELRDIIKKRKELRDFMEGMNIVVELKRKHTKEKPINGIQITMDEKSLPLLAKIRTTRKTRGILLLFALISGRLKIRFRPTGLLVRKLIKGSLKFVRFLCA